MEAVVGAAAELPVLGPVVEVERFRGVAAPKRVRDAGNSACLLRSLVQRVPVDLLVFDLRGRPVDGGRHVVVRGGAV